MPLAKSRGYYKFLIRLKTTLPNSANKLQSEFNIDATNLTMFYRLPKLVCIETYLRDFQFKVLNYITCTNILLKKMGIVESDLCTFCNLTKEIKDPMPSLFLLLPTSYLLICSTLKRSPP